MLLILQPLDVYKRQDKGRASHGVARTTNLLNENTLTFMKTFNEIHAVNVLGGITFQRTIFDNLTTTTTGLEIESLDAVSYTHLNTLQYIVSLLVGVMPVPVLIHT